MIVRKAESAAAEAVPAGTGTTRQVLIGPDEGPNFAMRRFRLEPGGSMRPIECRTQTSLFYIGTGDVQFIG